MKKILTILVVFSLFFCFACQENNEGNNDNPPIIEDGNDKFDDGENPGGDEKPDDNQKPDEGEKTKYNVVSGGFEEKEDSLISTSNNSIAEIKGSTFSGGTLLTSIKLSGVKSDNGVIFGIENPKGLSEYWENDVNYYFFFVSQGGTGYLGKVYNGTWSVCGETVIPNFSNSGEYEIKVVWNNKNPNYDIISGYINNELCVNFKDYEKLNGTTYGIRCGGKGTEYKNIKITSEINTNEDNINDYLVANGAWTIEDNKMKSTTGNAIAVKKNDKFGYGKISCDITTVSNGDNGIIFGLTSDGNQSFWESNVSYYFYFISSRGTAYLGKVNYGSWGYLNEVYIPNYVAGQTYNISVERNESVMKCYVNDNLMFTVADTVPLYGEEYGLRAGFGGVKYTNLEVDSTEITLPDTPDYVSVKRGNFVGNDNYLSSQGGNNLAIFNDISFESGSFKTKVITSNTGKAGIVFGYSDNSYYYFYVHKQIQKVELAYIENGQTTILYSNYLSAGFSVSAQYDMEVLIENNKAYCSFFKILYTVEDITLSSYSVGFAADQGGSIFEYPIIDSQAVHNTVDTLIFGHSYMELWSNYKNDLVNSNLGEFTNIGIGGSIASHWNNFEDSIVAFDPKLAIYMIGINDLTGGTSPTVVKANVESLLLNLRDRLGDDFEVILLSVNHCPARGATSSYDCTKTISQTNELYKYLAASHDWIWYAEIEYAYCSVEGNPSTCLSSWFTDGLHPTAAGYSKIVDAINKALKGENQPVLDSEQMSQLLLQAKNTKIGQLSNYSLNAYRTNEWNEAQIIYNEAINKINECSTISEINSLNISNYIEQLKNIKTKAKYNFEEMLNINNCQYYEDAVFTSKLNSSKNNKYNLANYGYRLNSKNEYSDVSFTFKVTNNNNPLDIAGVLFRTKEISSGTGVSGYLINYVSNPNYIQVWYLKEAYGGPANYLEYIGGWVFTGSVIGTEFRAVVEGDYIYIYTEEEYQKNGKDAYGCSVYLGSKGLYNSGYLGIISWQNGLNYELEINNIIGEEIN